MFKGKEKVIVISEDDDDDEDEWFIKWGKFCGKLVFIFLLLVFLSFVKEFILK